MATTMTTQEYIADHLPAGLFGDRRLEKRGYLIKVDHRSAYSRN